MIRRPPRSTLFPTRRSSDLVQRGFDAVRRRYERLLDGALEMRWAIVAAAVLVMLAAVPLYQNSRRELAPIEDQSHISLFMQASPHASLGAANKASPPGGEAI